MINTKQYESIILRSLIEFLATESPKADDVLLALNQQHFQINEYRQIYATINAMVQNKQQVTIQSLSLNLPDSFIEIINFLADEYPYQDIENAIASLKLAFMANKKFKLMSDCVSISKTIDNQVQLQQHIESYAQKVEELDCNIDNNTIKPTTMVQIFDDLEQGQIELRKRYYTGIETLDEAVDGFETKTLSTFAADTGQGKTQFSLTVAHKLSKSFPDRQVVMFSLEEDKLKIASRLAGIAYGKNYESLTPEEKHQAHKLACLPNFTIYDEKNLTIDQISKQVKLCARQQPISVILIDYIGLVQPREKNPRYDIEIKYLVSEFLKMAFDNDCFVIIPQQVNRVAESRKGPPSLNDLADSRETARYSHYVITLRSNEFQNIGFAVRKNRNGALKNNELSFNQGIIADLPFRTRHEASERLKERQLKK